MEKNKQDTEDPFLAQKCLPGVITFKKQKFQQRGQEYWMDMITPKPSHDTITVILFFLNQMHHS